MQVLSLSNNGIKGDLGDTNIMARLAQLADLRRLELANLPNLTGSLPATCPTPFNKLVHLDLSNTSVGGELPQCIIDSVQELNIAGTATTADS